MLIMKKRAICFLALLALVAVPNSTFAANASDFNGGVSIGSGYYGTTPAPTDGLIVQGNVGIGTSTPVSGAALTVNGAVAATSIILSGSQTPLPGGRLTLVSNTPIMSADALAATTVYYTHYINDLVPLYDGTNWKQYSIGGEISLPLDSNSGHTGYHQAGLVYDFVIRNNGGAPQLCTGPVWSSVTARASAIAQQDGIWTNSGSWTVRCDTTASTYTCAANQCTYVGSMLVIANGQTGLQCWPAIAAGGPSNGGHIGVWNAYNRVPISCLAQDSNTNWTYSASGDRWADNNSNNRIRFVDGLQVVSVDGSYTVQATNNTAGAKCIVAATLDNGTGRIYALFTAPTNNANNNWQTLHAPAAYPPQLGAHNLSARENVDGGTCTFNSFSNPTFNQTSMMLKLNFSY
jgi:hypothetical protein